jgi:uncharacterized protein
MNRYRILTLDGGGIRGYLSILLLEQLEQARPGFLSQVDLFAGTSTGSFIALGLAAGKSTSDIREMYEKNGRAIFQDSLIDNIRDLGFALGAKYSNENLQRVLIDQFGDMTLRNLSKRVLIASFDLDCQSQHNEQPRIWKAKFFHNYPGQDSDECERVVDVAMRSSAAPFYFPSYQGYVDGFVVANNPSMCAVAQALKTKVAALDEIVLLSVGTGLNPRYIDSKKGDWGWARWMVQLNPLSRRWYGMPLVYMMWEASVDLARYECEQLLGDRFLRLDPLLDRSVDIDEVRHMGYLRKVAQSTDLSNEVAWLDQNFPELDEVEMAAGSLV